MTIDPGSIVTILAFDDVPEHQFRVDEVFEDGVGGIAMTGPLAGDYGETDWSLIKKVQAGITHNPAPP
ncbi:hypothetical protein SAMN05421850_1152 [Lutimaribacter saemankumensis]|uniref:Uncharacterized protein n=2 Tax=Lutimaribacter saemankumensis TaxID=490829 RepID=A0A1G8T0Q6_9RHOB|nr:hypothetical protein SAMN05421850_1152 [Lutimaribacter saemankumensis]